MGDSMQRLRIKDRLETDFEAELAAQEAKFKDLQAHENEHIALSLNGEGTDKCTHCGRDLAKELPDVKAVSDKIRERDAREELKINPPDWNERFHTDPLYVRIKRQQDLEGNTGYGEGNDNVGERLLGGVAKVGAAVVGKIGYEAGKSAGRVIDATGIKEPAAKVASLPGEYVTLKEQELGAAINKKTEGFEQKAEDFIGIAKLRAIKQQRDEDKAVVQAVARKKKEAEDAARAKRVSETTKNIVEYPTRLAAQQGTPLFAEKQALGGRKLF